MDSPRGRIYLMDLASKGEIGLQGAFTEHIDACLGCMACVTACPSGVQYDKLLESVRPQVERNVRRDRSDRLFREAIFALFPYKRRLRAAALPGALYQRLREVPGGPGARAEAAGRLAAMESLLPPVSVKDAFATLPVFTPAAGPRRGRVALLTGCVQDVFFHRVNAATVRVLAAEGHDVLVPRDQQCCGALELHAGREDPALARARREIAVFETLDVDHVVTNVAGCGSSMKEYGTCWPTTRSGRGAPPRSPRASATSTRCWPRTRRPRRGTRWRRGWPTTTPATSATPRACATSPARCCGPCRASRSSTSPRPRCAAGRPGSTTW
jgi:glycolate oxidase iron-sulfur subunit